jgi:hypothetical protein
MVLHTWDQKLGAHFPMHSVIPAGALGKEGQQWLAIDPRFLFLIWALSTVFREKFLDARDQARTSNALTCTGKTANLGTSTGFARLKARLRHGLRHKALRRSRARARVSRSLHPSRGDEQPPPGRRA